MSDPLEHFVDVLRQPGTPGELAGESHAVDALASSFTSQKGSPVKSTSGRRMRVASFIAAGVIGFGGAAAAGPGTFSDDSFEDAVAEIAEETTETTTPVVDEPTETTTPETTAPETTIPETTIPETTIPETTVPETTDPEADTPPPTEVELAEEPVDDDSGEPVDDPDTLFDETECAEGNHGKTVSSVARTEGRTAEDVRNAAHSSCGKKTDADEDPDAVESDDDADESDDDGQEKDKSSNPGKGHGKDKSSSKAGKDKSSNPGKGHGKKSD